MKASKTARTGVVVVAVKVVSVSALFVKPTVE